METYQLLEKRWAEFNGFEAEQVVACSSGTAALHLALESLQLSPGSRVICPDYTMIACARAITLAGHSPVFVDCDDDLNMDEDAACSVVRQRGGITAVMAVHVYGRKCNMEELSNPYPSDPARTFIVEDMSEIHGARPHALTDAACWSFYKNKVVGGEEGGAVAFRNVEHAKLARQLRSLGFTEQHDFYHIPRGHNYRLANCLAEKVLASLDDYQENMRRRIRVEQWYEAECPDEWKMPLRDVPWVYDLRLKLPPFDGVGYAPKVVKALNDAGIAARQGFKPMREQEEYREHGHRSSRAFWAGREIVYLPITPQTTRDECRRAFRLAREVVSGRE